MRTFEAMFVGKRIGHITIQTLLCWALVAFIVSTTVLGVEKSMLKADLKDARSKLDYLQTLLETNKTEEYQQRSKRSIIEDAVAVGVGVGVGHNGEEYHHRSKRSIIEDAVAMRVDRNDDEEVVIDYRLPGNVLPQTYNVYIHPDMEEGTFTGQETIVISVAEATQQIILHAHQLTIEHVYVQSSAQTVEVESYELEEAREFLIINLSVELQEGSTITLGIIFAGVMRDKLVGLYSSSYKTANQEQRTIATSKFEPTYARQAFPCFDEPAMKAKFVVTLIHPTDGDYHALSNMNEVESTNQGSYTEVRFAESVSMSTYLACFIISDFVSSTATIDTNGIGDEFDLRIFTTPHQIAKVDFALETSVAVTEYYIRYFNVEYPLPKLDMAAVPDFSANAMENWGLITYRETALLYDPNYSSTWNQQRIAAVCAHELAHMWFGNLVTMDWWNDVWLNEGFARYMEYKAVNEVYSEWGMLDQFLIHALHSVLKFDSTTASHAIRQNVSSPGEITELFDTISYEKGASMLRMLEDAVGVENFSTAITNYLNNFKYGNAVTDDFIHEVANVGVDFDVEAFMLTWTEQMGFPVVEVEQQSSSEYVLKQKRFFSNSEDYEEDNDYKWIIPLTYYTDTDKTVQRQFFSNEEDSLTVTFSSDTTWVKFNVDQIGYYRVNYEEALWQQFNQELLTEPNTFSISDRAHLLNDIFALADANELSYDLALNMTKYLDKESDFVPWYVAAAKLQDLQAALKYTDTYVKYRDYARNLITNIYDQQSWTVDEGDDAHLKNRLRVTILTAACALGVSDCLSQATTKFNAWLEDPSDKPAPDLREIVYYYGMQEVGNLRIWENVWQVYLEEEDATEKLKLMYGLSGIREPWILHRFVDLAANEEYIRGQDYFTCLQNIAANPIGEPVVWEYVRENWLNLVERFGLNYRYLGRMIPTITAHFDTTVKLNEMNEFFAKYPEAGAGTAARSQALETVKYNIKWLSDNKDEIATWLSNNEEE